MVLSAQRCLHTAISVTGVETAAVDGHDQRQKGDEGEPAELPSSSTTSDPDATAVAIQPAQAAEGSDVAPAEAVQLWNPISAAGVGGAAVPESARSAGSDKCGAGTSTKKKSGAKESAAAAKKSGSSTAAAGSTGGGDCPGGESAHDNVPEAEGAAPAVFESVLIFGGIVDEAIVSGVSC